MKEFGEELGNPNFDISIHRFALVGAGHSSELYDENWVADRRTARVNAFSDGIHNGEMPPLGNGFAFVLDERPAGSDSPYIPAIEYTHYLSQRQLPIAAPWEALHRHDVGHVYSYQWLLGSAAAARMAYDAANNSLSDSRLAGEFANTFDKLGDSIRVILEPRHAKIERRKVHSASNYIAQLSHLALHGEVLAIDFQDPPMVNAARDPLCAEVHEDLGLVELHDRAFSDISPVKDPFKVEIPSIHNPKWFPAVGTY